jgi:hypothetical protein
MANQTRRMVVGVLVVLIILGAMAANAAHVDVRATDLAAFSSAVEIDVPTLAPAP